MKWEPIDTAPKDGTDIIIAHFDGDFAEISSACWNLWPKEGQEGLHGFYGWLENEPTHWTLIVFPEEHSIPALGAHNP